MDFALASFIRMFKMLSMSVCCSFFLLVMQLFFNQNFVFLHVVSLVAFLGIIGVDTYRFSSLYPSLKDGILGLFLPLVGCCGLVAVGYFFIPENLFNYIFLPLRAFEGLDFLGAHSLLLSCACWLVVIILMSWIGSMHPIDFEEDYFSPQS